jgi:hypothetical protein
MSVNLYKINNDTYEREILGSVTESQLAFLVKNLEEEFEEDEEYFFSAETLQYLRAMGADKELLSMLEKAVAGTEGGVDIFYAVE